MPNTRSALIREVGGIEMLGDAGGRAPHEEARADRPKVPFVAPDVSVTSDAEGGGHGVPSVDIVWGSLEA